MTLETISLRQVESRNQLYTTDEASEDGKELLNQRKRSIGQCMDN
jgi:hypothetical protein